MSSIGVAGSADAVEDIQLQSEREDFYSTVKSNRLSEDLVLVETSRERSIRKACETLAADMIEMIRTSFPAFEGSGINSSWQLDAAKLGIDLDGETSADVKSMALDSVKSPSLLLQSIITHTSRIKTLVHKEMDMIDIRADAELLRVANYCLKLAGEQEKVVTERWLPELRNAVQEAQRCFEDCRRVRGLVDEWYIGTSNLQQQ